MPAIKLSANPRTIRTMSEHMDVDVSGILRREMNLDQAGDKLLDMMFQTIAGRMTAAEALKQNQFVMTQMCIRDSCCSTFRYLRGCSFSLPCALPVSVKHS